MGPVLVGESVSLRSTNVGALVGDNGEAVMGGLVTGTEDVTGDPVGIVMGPFGVGAGVWGVPLLGLRVGTKVG